MQPIKAEEESLDIIYCVSLSYIYIDGTIWYYLQELGFG